MLTATVVLVLADLGWLLYQAASMSGVALPSAIGVVPTVLTQTHVGYGWSVAFAGALLLLGTTMAGHTGMLRNALLWFAVIVIAAGKASLGHAADAGPLSAPIAMQTLHVLVTSVWGVGHGGVAVVIPAIGHAADDEETPFLELDRQLGRGKYVPHRKGALEIGIDAIAAVVGQAQLARGIDANAARIFQALGELVVVGLPRCP